MLTIPVVPTSGPKLVGTAGMYITIYVDIHMSIYSYISTHNLYCYFSQPDKSKK